VNVIGDRPTFIVQTHKISVPSNPPKSSSKNGTIGSYDATLEPIIFVCVRGTMRMIETYMISNGFKNLTT